MTGGRVRALAALATAALTAAVASVAFGAEPATGIRLAEATGSNFPDMAFVLSLPEQRQLDAADIRVRENGAPVQDVTVVKPGAEDLAVVLVIDASNSMKGAPIEGAMAAARAFAERRTPGQPLSLITFNSSVDVVVPLTNDGVLIREALAKAPPLADKTHIYDALDKARSVLADSGISAGSIVLLSDGADVGSKLDQAATIADLKEARVRVFTVGLSSQQYNPETLERIASETAGTYAEASGADTLKRIYSQLGFTLANEYLLRYRSLAGPSEKLNVSVTINDVAGTGIASYQTPALPQASVAPGPSTWDRIIRSSITLYAIILVVVYLLGYGVFRIVYRPDRQLMRRIGQFVNLPEEERAKQRQEEVAATLASDSRRPSDGFWQRLERDMSIAGIETPPRTMAILTGIAGLAIGVVVSLAIGSPIGLLAIVAAPLIPRAVVSRRLNATRRLFGDQLPDNLDVITSGLRSGHSFTGALAVCIEDAAEPSKSEFRRVVADDQLGVPIDEALHVTARRMANRDLVQIALVAKLQQQAGTNAADVLDQVSENVRARLELRRLITTLTAQGRMARWIVSLLPVVLFIAIYLLNRTYLSPLWNEALGIAALIVAIIMVILGSLVIKRIIEIEV